MSEEYFDIVDENNQPTGMIKLRSEAHTQGFWHRVVFVYFFRQSNNNLEFLVHLRSKNKDLQPNKWDTRFGGHLKSGETYNQTALSEIKEEVGLEIEFNDLIEGEVSRRGRGTNNEFAKEFFYEFLGDIKELKFLDDEVQAVKWLSAKEIILQLENHPENWAGSLSSFSKTLENFKSLLKSR